MDAQLHRAQWRKSTYSGQNGGCVEVAAWRKSTYSGQNGSCVEVAAWQKSSHSGQNGDCVEVARDLPSGVAVRDSKDPEGPRLDFAPERWRAFTRRVNDGGANPA